MRFGEISIIHPKYIKDKISYYDDNFDEHLISKTEPYQRIVDACIVNKEENETNNKTAICEKCETEINVLGKERRYGCFGLPYIECPYCGGKAYIEEEDGIYVDETNLEFPQHFFKFGDDQSGAKIKNEEITKWAKNALKKLREQKNSDFYIEATGDSCCIGLNFENEIDVIVCKNYYEFTFDK